MLERTLKLDPLLKKKSFFLFGPRATGKTALIHKEIASQSVLIDLLQSQFYLPLASNPGLLTSMIEAQPDKAFVVIDEIQKIPALLNEVHHLIESRGLRFLMTGSSARSLRSRGVNLLAGRAWEAHLFPLTYRELPSFDLDKYLHFGGLPNVALSSEPIEELDAYVNTYLREEIQMEAYVRHVQTYMQFLSASAFHSGEILNYTAISSQTGTPASTVREYYQLLEDTLMGFTLPAWRKTVKRKASSTGKFYFFDLGVKHMLSGVRSIDPKSDLFGKAFEHFLILEIRAFLSYQRVKLPLHFWRSLQGDEVDVIIGDDVAIEIKATSRVQDKHLKGLSVLQKENICKDYYLISQDPVARKIGNITLLPWATFLDKLYDGDVVA